jgi:hypothetical protein
VQTFKALAFICSHLEFLQARIREVGLRLQLAGRIRNLTKHRFWLIAVAEAVQNAMDAIADSKRVGSVRVQIERGEDLLSAMDGIRPVRDVIISDTGIGFNEPNFNSFCTPDSLHKLARGGKGLGRLVCLQTFKKIEGLSVYSENGGNRRREFCLQCEEPEISHCIEQVEEIAPKTEVRLLGLREEYTNVASITFERIVDWLFQHFLPALIGRPTWLTTLVVTDGDKSCDLTSKISGGATWSEEVLLKNYSFSIKCYSLGVVSEPVSSELHILWHRRNSPSAGS